MNISKSATIRRSLRVSVICAGSFLMCSGSGQSTPAAGQAVHEAVSSRETMQALAITEEQLRQQLQGKTFYLRDGYLENNLHFDQDGKLDGTSPKASYTLSLVEIQRVHLEKHKLELEGVRYGLHFLGASPTEDQTQAIDKVRLTSKKKPLRIVINRETVVKPKEKKPKHDRHEKTPAKPGDAAQQARHGDLADVSEAERTGLKTTTSQDHANRALQQAIDRVLSPGIDERMITALPDYWQLFYKAVRDKADYHPADSSIFRQSQVDRKARLISAIDPASNEFAQNNGVAGPALYHVVLDANGKPQIIAIGRPIGFGLDENAVDSIRRAKFEPAIRGGKAVPVLLDVTVEFRIYSGRTAAAAAPHVPPIPAATSGDRKPELPGPYTARILAEQQQKNGAEAATQQTTANSQPAAASQPAVPQPKAAPRQQSQPAPAPQ